MNRKIPTNATKIFSTKLFAVYTKEVEQFDGSYKTFERVRTYDSVKALCVVEDKIIILHTEMPGHEPFLSLPGGMLDLGESEDEGIRREVQEETGIIFQSFEKIYTMSSNIGLVEGYKHFYIAREPVSFGEQHLDEGERLTLEYVTFDQFIAYLTQGKISKNINDVLISEYILPGKTDDLKKLLFG